MREHLPHRFAIAVDPHISFVYRIEKILLNEDHYRDISKLYGESSEDGVIRYNNTIPPNFSSELISHNGHTFEIEFCITPLLFSTFNHQTYPVVIIRNFNRIQRFIRTFPSYVESIRPSSNEWVVRDLLRFLFNHFDTHDYNPGERRWPNGLRPYPEQYSFDFNWRDMFPSEEYTPPPRRLSARRISPPPSPSERTPPEPSQSSPTPSKPLMPAERIALALARDSIAQGEICPITQDKLQPTKIGVTGCLCVFQGEALEKFEGPSCPSCRSPLTIRYVLLKKEENGIISKESSAEGTKGTNSQTTL